MVWKTAEPIYGFSVCRAVFRGEICRGVLERSGVFGKHKPWNFERTVAERGADFTGGRVFCLDFLQKVLLQEQIKALRCRPIGDNKNRELLLRKAGDISDIVK